MLLQLLADDLYLPTLRILILCLAVSRPSWASRLCHGNKVVRDSCIRRYVQFTPAGTTRSVSIESAYVIYAIGIALALISLSLVFVADVLWEQ